MQEELLPVMARRLGYVLSAKGIHVKHGQALNAISALVGYRNWAELQSSPDRILSFSGDSRAAVRFVARIAKDFSITLTTEQLESVFGHRSPFMWAPADLLLSMICRVICARPGFSTTGDIWAGRIMSLCEGVLPGYVRRRNSSSATSAAAPSKSPGEYFKDSLTIYGLEALASELELGDSASCADAWKIRDQLNTIPLYSRPFESASESEKAQAINKLLLVVMYLRWPIPEIEAAYVGGSDTTAHQICLEARPFLSVATIYRPQHAA